MSSASHSTAHSSSGALGMRASPAGTDDTGTSGNNRQPTNVDWFMTGGATGMTSIKRSTCFKQHQLDHEISMQLPMSVAISPSLFITLWN